MMTARMASRRSVRGGMRRMGVVDAADGCGDGEVQDALLFGSSLNGKAVLIWWRDLPERFFSPARRTDEEADRFLSEWNFGEELAIRFNNNMKEIES